MEFLKKLWDRLMAWIDNGSQSDQKERPNVVPPEEPTSFESWE